MTRVTHFIRRYTKGRQAPIAACVATALLIVGALVVSSSLYHPHNAVALAPTSVGLGEGVAACFSSIGPSCSGTNVVYTVDLQGIHGNGSGGCGDNFGYGAGGPFNNPDVYINGVYYGQMACSGPATFSFPAAPGQSIHIQAILHFTNTVLGDETFTAPDCTGGGSAPAAPTGDFTPHSCALLHGQTSCQPTFDWSVSGSNGVVLMNFVPPGGGEYAYCGNIGEGPGSNGACYGPFTAGAYLLKLYTYDGAGNQYNLANRFVYVTPAPTGTITPYACTIPVGGSGCQPSFDWNTSNSNNTVTVNIIGGSTYPGESAYCGGGNIGPRNTGGRCGPALPPATYNLMLYAQDVGWNWGTPVDTKPVTVSCASGSAWNGSICAASTPPPNVSSISATCPAPGTTATFTWPAVAGADMYQIQYNSSTGSCLPSSWTLWTGNNTTCYTDPTSASVCSGSSCSISIPTTPGLSTTVSVNDRNAATILWADWTAIPSMVFSCAAAASSFDLTAGNVPQSTAITGQQIILTSIIANIGNAGTGSSFTDLLEISKNVQPIPSTPFSSFTTVLIPRSSSLAAAGNPGSSFTDNVPYTFLTPGTYYVRACANMTTGGVEDLAGESDFTNNCSPNWNQVDVKSDLGGGCSSSAQCLSGICNSSNMCATPLPNGSVCSVSSDCASNYCDATTHQCANLPVCTPGGPCTSALTACGTNNGTYNATCTVCTPPSCSAPTFLTANPAIVQQGGSTLLSWSGPGKCTVNGTNGFSSILSSDTNHDSGIIYGQTVFTLTCGGVVQKTATVRVIGTVIEQ